MIIGIQEKSLLIIKSQTNNNGAIIASSDTDIMQDKKDTYSYMWPRDGALISRSLDKTGYTETTEQFFDFCKDIISDKGYFLHKYLPDKSLGSSWHPWLKFDKLQLPIQEDETALILDAFWKKHSQYENKKILKEYYKDFVKKAGDFLLNYRDSETKLPKESYDLWEEKLGVHTFTCCTVYAGLMAAHYFAEAYKRKRDAKKYLEGAKEVKRGILKYLYDDEKEIFIKGVYQDKEGNWHKDKTIDMSTVYGLFEYKILDINDPKLQKTMEKTIEKLKINTNVGGIIRYEKDNYFRINKDSPSNPWFVSTLWLAEYYIAKAKNFKELKPAIDIFSWVCHHALPSGCLSEQVHPYDGKQVSVSPLTWSHAGLIIAIIKYLDKLDKMGLCKGGSCYPLRRKPKKKKLWQR